MGENDVGMYLAYMHYIYETYSINILYGLCYMHVNHLPIAAVIDALAFDEEQSGRVDRMNKLETHQNIYLYIVHPSVHRLGDRTIAAQHVS
jgi:hypothetical protein